MIVTKRKGHNLKVQEVVWGALEGLDQKLRESELLKVPNSSSLKKQGFSHSANNKKHSFQEDVSKFGFADVEF